MKFLPLGIQHFDELIENRGIYVDKTELVFSLLQSKGAYFLSRPRRFEKSLLLSTMDNMDAVEILCNELFAHLSYDFFMKKEFAVHCMIHIYFKYLGMQIESEVLTTRGRLDAAVFTPTHIYIFEFKIDKSTDDAIEQITKKDYSRKYSHTNKIIISIWANFVTDKRDLDAWKILCL